MYHFFFRLKALLIVTLFNLDSVSLTFLESGFIYFDESRIVAKNGVLASVEDHRAILGKYDSSFTAEDASSKAGNGRVLEGNKTQEVFLVPVVEREAGIMNLFVS